MFLLHKAHALAALLFVGCLLRATHAAEFKFTARRSMPGNDINCNQLEELKDTPYPKPTGPRGEFPARPPLKPLPFCRLCTSFTSLADACTANSNCKGFDLRNIDTYCGYLKAAAGPGNMVYTEGFSSFCKVGAGPCTGDYNLLLRTDIPGNDIDCNAKDNQGKRVSYCRVPGGLAIVADACKANPSCKAFVMIGDSEGYLKTATGPTRYTEKAVAFIP